MPTALSEVLTQATKKLTPHLAAALEKERYCELKTSFHIQDGTLTHVKENVEDRIDPHGNRNDGASPSNPDTVLRDCLRVLKLKLELALSRGWHGVITLCLEIEAGNCILITCGSEQVHKMLATSRAAG